MHVVPMSMLEDERHLFVSIHQIDDSNLIEVWAIVMSYVGLLRAYFNRILFSEVLLP